MTTCDSSSTCLATPSVRRVAPVPPVNEMVGLVTGASRVDLDGSQPAPFELPA